MSGGTKTIGFRRILIRGPFNQRTGKATVREIVHELHATKGWRRAEGRTGTTSNRDVPALEVTFKRTRPPVEHAPFTLSPDRLEKARMRHAWYRQQKAREAFRASLPAANVHPDYHTEAQRKEASQ